MDSKIRRELQKFKLIKGGKNIIDKLRLLIWFFLPRRFKVTFQLGQKILSNVILTLKDGSKFYVTPPYSMIKQDNLEIEIRNWFTCPKNGVFMDAGANIGFYSVIMAKKVKNIIAFEPTPGTIKILLRNLELNKINNVKVFPFALWKDKGTSEFIIHRYSGVNSLVIPRKKIEIDRINVHTIDGDSLSIDRLDLLKMDIEGAEWEALHGMEGTLRKFKPRIIVEIQPMNNPRVINYLHEIGYSLIDRQGKNYLFEWNS